MAKSPLISRLRLLGAVALAGLLVFIALQFVGPKVTNPPVVADLDAPADVKAVLKTSCYNCHSNETHLWWYDKIAPASWLVARDVKRGRMHMNFSNFGQLSPAQQKGYLYESVNQMQLGAMPPANYLLVHPEAKVTPEQLDTLKKYLHPTEAVTPATPEAVSAADEQYQKWIAGGGAAVTTGVSPTANGIPFFYGYQDWKPVSTTDRFDNGTLRVILGNDVAQNAIASGNVHPWPDGSAFAKIAYKQQPDASGNIWTGEFIQVEFMLKDAQKYKSTEGWGFARWRGVDHKPYGKNANFTTECTSCHRPMEANDFVYTMPINNGAGEAFNATAALPGRLPYDPLQWRVITSSVNKTDGTMSTLYGNDAAIAQARSTPQTPYPAGAVLALVTWNEQEDKHWFGGRIPGVVRSVEFVRASGGTNGSPSYSYDIYAGAPLEHAANDTSPAGVAATLVRVNAITGLKAAVMP
jgi:hypothetical protein